MPSIEGFSSLTSSIYVRQPAAETDGIIIICTWMAASPKLVNRYALRFADEHPSSTLILLTSDPIRFLLGSDATWRTGLAPAVDQLLAVAGQPISAIAYSNGGVKSLVHLAEAFRARTTRPLALHTTILDSAPGSDGIVAGHRALMLSLHPSTALTRPIASALIWAYLAMYWLYGLVSRSDNVIRRLRRGINDATLFANHGKRIYVYSAADRMVGLESVESSAKEAEMRGWDVGRERFVGSGHVAHALQEPERYWGIVRGLAKQ